MSKPAKAESHRCNARKKGNGDLEKLESGPHGGEGYCGQPAGWGTDHTGVGRCKYHNGRPPTHGRYARYLSTSLGDEIARLKEDPDPLNLDEELATARALLARALDRDGEDAIEVDQLMHLVAEVSKIVKRVEDARAASAISLPELTRLMREMGRIVAYHVGDQATIDEILHEWRDLRL